MTLDELKSVLASVEYKKGYHLQILTVGANWCEVAVVHSRPDSISGEMREGVGGKAILTTDWSEDAIVRKCFSLFLQYEEHECREFFRYEGVQVFGPHIKVRALMSVADQVD